jgi:branched-chain amino acid transport system permease protein
MDTVITILINGLVTSSVYILVALGFALLLSIVGIFNFAHGAMYMVGAWVTYAFSQVLGLNLWASLVFSILVLGGFGLLVERFCFRPFKLDPNKVMIMAISLILFLTTTVTITLGGFTRPSPNFVEGILKTPLFSASMERLTIIVIAAILLPAVYFFIKGTKTGKQMLAVAQNPEGAALQGISSNRIWAVTMALACMMACLAGSMMATILSLSPYMGDNMLTKAIEVVILTGIGSVGGILWGGLIIGFLDAALPIFTTNDWATAIGLGVIIVILLIRPKGLFGYELF